MWRADLENPIISIHIQSDASPVTGTELQGMLLDICFLGGAILRRYLPPMSLAYGFCSAIDKTVALLWSLWLVAGPREEDLRWVCDRIKSVTTDLGTEILTAQTPAILHCFHCWLQGRPLDSMARSVRSTTRLFPRCLRIAGWMHTLGNVMRQGAERSPSWNRYKTHIRALCKFFRNETYRNHLVRLLHPLHPVLNLEPKLRTFSAQLAKWRFQTARACAEQLLPLRELCEGHLREELFPNIQDIIVHQLGVAMDQHNLQMFTQL